MSEQFQEQGGAATMDPNPLLRWLTSRVMNRVISPRRLALQRERYERRRQKAGEPHIVEYFHQVDDGYSHLAAQVLEAVCTRYDITLRCHLVSAASGKNAPEPELLLALSRYDAAKVAPEYDLRFPQGEGLPEPGLVTAAAAIMAAQDDARFANCAANYAARRLRNR